jgi:hypothetical protein
LSLYAPKSAIFLFTNVALDLTNISARRFSQLSNNSPRSKLLHLDVVSISAVAFRCNNYHRHGISCNFVAANDYIEPKSKLWAFCALLRLIIVVVTASHRWTRLLLRFRRVGYSGVSG